jgi:hypothetical protein
MPSRIVINGREYDSPDDMPPRVRAVYERLMADADGNGVPDLIDDARRDDPGADSAFVSHESFVIDGKTYRSLDEIPPELRRMAREAMRGPRGEVGRPAIPQGAVPGAVDRSARALPPGFEPPASRLPAVLFGVAIGAGLMLLTMWVFGRS